MEILRRTLSALLALVMVVTMLPMGALAEESEPTIPETSAETEPAETIETVPAETEPVEVVPETTAPEVFTEETAESMAAAVATSGTCGENLTWILDNSGTLTISGKGKMTEYYSVSDIPWYENRERITGLIIDEGITSLNRYAFYECTALESIHFKATAMEDLTSSSVAFYRAGINSNGIEVVIGEAVSKIPAYLFYVSSYSSDVAANIVTVHFERDSVCESIGDWAFRGCSALTSITIPKSVTNIGRYAFYYCFNLLVQFDAMELPKSLGESWDNGAAICLNAKSFGVTEYGQKYWVTNENTVCVWKYDGKDTELVIPETIDGYPVVEIAVSAFYNCNEITNVKIPNNVTTIESYAFYNCHGLTSITIPQNVTTLGESVFYNCTSVENIYYNSIAMNDFTSSTEPFGFTYPTNSNPDVNLVIGRHVTRIPAYLFYSYYSSHAVPLIRITFEEGSVCESIGVCAFHCSSLTAVTIPKNVRTIHTDAFSSCKNLTSLTFEEGSVCENIGHSAFTSSGLAAVTIPKSVKKINAYAFAYCGNLTSITFCGNALTIDSNSFSSVTASAYYPANNDTWTDKYKEGYGGTLTWIAYDNPQGTHTHNYSVEVTYPTCLDEGYTTFTCSCGDSYVDDYVKANGHSYGEWYETVVPVQGKLGEEQRDCKICNVYETRPTVSWTFEESTGTLTIIGVGGMKDYNSSDEQPWYGYSNRIQNVFVEDGVTSIGSYSFSALDSLTKATVSGSVQSIGECVFEGSSNLEKINFWGSEIQWNEIKISEENTILLSKPIYFSTWNGEIDTSWEYSDGRYNISNAAELAGLAKQVNEGKLTTTKVRLTSDINLNGSDSLQWVPIGTQDNQSMIYLDGDGHTIKNLYINTHEDYQGLFGYVDRCFIEDIILQDFYISGGNDVGGIVGYISTFGTWGDFEQCVVLDGKISGKNSVGGIIGSYDGPWWGSAASIKKCFNSATVTGQKYVGGIIGNNHAKAENAPNNRLVVSESINSGNIKGEDEVGGIIGGVYLLNGAELFVIDCCNVGDISASEDAGGIIGDSWQYGINDYPWVFVNNCFNSGHVSGKAIIDSDVWSGGYGKTTIQNCYYLSGASTEEEWSPGTALSGSAMRSKSSFVDWDFKSTWMRDDGHNDGFPYLKWAEEWVEETDDDDSEYDETYPTEPEETDPTEPVEDETEATEPDPAEDEYRIEVYSIDRNLTIKPGQQLQLLFALYRNDELVPDWDGLSWGTNDGDIIKVASHDRIDNGYRVFIKGLQEGTATFNIADGKLNAKFSLEIKVTSQHATPFGCSIENVPSRILDVFGDDGTQVNFYNINGLYVSDYWKSDKPTNGKYTVKFNVYSHSYMHGSVDIYDANDNWIGSKRIDKNQNVRGIVDTAYKGIVMVAGWFSGDGLSYKAVSYTKETKITIEVPVGGRFVISNNIAQSPGVFLYNAIDAYLQALKVACDGFGDTNESQIKKIQDLTVEKLLESDEFYDAYQKAMVNMIIDIPAVALQKGYVDAMTGIVDLLLEYAGETVNMVISSAFNIAEDVFKAMIPPEISIWFDFLFGISEVTDTLGQCIDISRSPLKSYIVIYTPQAGDKMIVQGITAVPSKNALPANAKLSVNRISTGDALSVPALGVNTEKYQLFDISFISDGIKVQPSGMVEIYLPVPTDYGWDNYQVLHQQSDGTWESLDSRIEGENIVVEVDSFSLFAIVEGKNEPHKLGDVNHDNKINAKDATLILQKSVGVLKPTAKFCEECAEVSGDSKLNAKDSTLILQFSVGLRDSFPAQK